MELKLSAPIHVHWEFTRDCNLNCLHCYQQDDLVISELSEHEVLSIAKELINSKIFQVTLTGGEPFSKPYLEKVVREFNKNNIIPHITTNGTLLKKGTFDWIRQIDATFQISVDSHNEHVHNHIRRNEFAFQLALKGIEWLKENDKYVSIAFCANKTNYQDIEGVIKLAIEHNVNSVVIGEVLPFFGNNTNKNELQFSKSEYNDFINLCLRLKDKYQKERQIFINTEWGFLFFEQIEHAPCSALDRDLAILYDGSVSPCPFIRSQQYYVGNITSQSLNDIWLSEKAEFFRNQKHLGCDNNCRFFEKCLSGCKAELANLGLPLNNKDRRCYIIK